MASFGKHFQVNQKNAISPKGSIAQGNYYRITVLTDRLIRLEYSKDGIFNDHLTDLVINRNFPVPKFKREEDDKYLVITTAYFSLQYLKEKPFKGPSFAPDANLKVKLMNTDKVWYYDHPEARNFLSSSFSLDNYNGKNNKLNKGLYSTDGFATLSDSNPLIINETGLLVNSDAEDTIDLYLFMYRRDFGLCLKDYYTLTGYPTLIPRYALGIWWNRDKIYSFEDTKKLINAFNTNEIPLSVLLLNEFWHIKDKNNINLYKTGYTFNKNLFPQPEEFIKYMHNKKIRVGINIDPVEGVRKEEDAYQEIITELNLNNKKTIPFNAFDKMCIITYMQYLIEPLVKLDIDFFWMDYQKDIRSLRALGYYHIKDFARNEAKRPMLLIRNPGVSAHRLGILYSGETIVSWDTLKYLPFYNSNASNIGLSWWSHDIGGYKDGIEDAELYMRYIQFATFNPIFRLGAKRGPYYKREPWLWDFKTYNIVKNYMQLRQKIIPYLYTEAYAYSANGLPLIQPIYYSYPDIYDDLELRNEYYFGSQLFISPITKPQDLVMNRVIQRLYLPKGIWYDFKTGKKFVGENRYVTFYKDEDYPVFAKAGAIIPMNNIMYDYNSIENPSTLDIQIFPGKSNAYDLYEDDGYTRLYERGYYIITGINYVYEKNKFSLEIKPVAGKTAIIPAQRNYNLIFRNTKKPERIEVLVDNTIKVNAMAFEETENNFTIKLSGIDTTRKLTINCHGSDLEIDAKQILNDDINSILSDLKIPTKLKEEIAKIAFSDLEIRKKRIAIRKLKSKGLSTTFIKMFMELYDYVSELN